MLSQKVTLFEKMQFKEIYFYVHGSHYQKVKQKKHSKNVKEGQYGGQMNNSLVAMMTTDKKVLI